MDDLIVAIEKENRELKKRRSMLNKNRVFPTTTSIHAIYSQKKQKVTEENKFNSKKPKPDWKTHSELVKLMKEPKPGEPMPLV